MRHAIKSGLQMGEIMSKWEKSHEKLQCAFANEISLRQQILGNLNHQEYALLIDDTQLQRTLNQESNALVNQLKVSIKYRSSCTRNLFNNLASKTTETSLDKILDPTKEVEEETLLLYQKTYILVKKIHEQHIRIKALFKLIKENGPLYEKNSFIYTKSIGKNKKQTTLTTIDYPKKSDVK